MRSFVVPLLAAQLFALPQIAHAGVEVSFESLPAPVRATVQREVKTGQILEIERDKKKGQPIFEIEFMDAGVKWELDVALDGTLLARHQD